ncbi:MAG: hypothetical protein M1834_008926 [Cirrosporium novae-zelandiae]|nr:MAG: hypothetical protein M1834_008926 [Cirrosporium novae-zelandiae]
MTTEPASVIIIGAGVVGLTLGQALKKQNIPFCIYERDESPFSRGQGWAITLHWALPYLYKMLPASIISRIESIQVDPNNSGENDKGNFLFLNLQTCEIKCKIPPNLRWRISREKMRQALLMGLEDNVKWGKRVVDVKKVEDSEANKVGSTVRVNNPRIKVIFHDGTSTMGLIALGIEGSCSVIRQILRPDAYNMKQLLLRFTGVAITLTPDQIKPLRDLDPLLFQGCHPETGTHLWYSVLETPSTNGTKGKEQELYKAQIFSETDEGRIKNMKRRAQCFASVFRDAVNLIPENSLSMEVKLADWECLDWDNHGGTLTLVGDSAHAMTMYRGEAANHGLLDNPHDLAKGTEESYLANHVTVTRSNAIAANPPFPSAEGPACERNTSSPSVLVRPPRVTYYSNGRARISGATHWAKLVHEFEEARPYAFGLVPEYSDTFRRVKDLKYLYPPRRSRNFPFGDSITGMWSKSLVLQFLPNRATVEMLVENYMNTFERTHRLFHPSTFRAELSKFWDNQEETSDAWLSQLLMMLSLSCQSAPQSAFDGLDDDRTGLAEKCLDAAEATFKRSPFMTYPDVAVVRTLCMMAVAKAMDIVTLDDSGSLWMLMGFIVRLAMSMSLHRDPKWFHGMPAFEAEMRRRIWTTIVFLDLSVAIQSGMSFVISPSDADTSPPSNLDDLGLDEPGRLDPPTQEEIKFTDSTFQIKLAQSFSIVSFVISNMNSAEPGMKYTKVIECDTKIRTLLQEAQLVFAVVPDNGSDPIRSRTALLQQTMFEIFLRRTLLALHQPYALDSQSLLNHQTSHWAVLECSLALLHCQQSLQELLAGRTSIQWFAELFKGDFAFAILYVILGLRRKDFSDNPDGKAGRPAKDTVWAALRACVDILQGQVGRSVYHFKIYMGIMWLVAALEALDSGSSMLDCMERAGKTIIETVQRSRPAPASSTTFPITTDLVDDIFSTSP